jgi:alkanesulfonate monooxygenase
MIGGGGEKRTLRLVAQYADACNIAAGPEAGRKLDVLRTHCDALGRDFDEVEKTTMLTLDPGQSAYDLVRRAEELRDLGFSAAYVYARDIAEPGAVIDVLGAAVARLA